MKFKNRDNLLKKYWIWIELCSKIRKKNNLKSNNKIKSKILA